MNITWTRKWSGETALDSFLKKDSLSRATFVTASRGKKAGVAIYRQCAMCRLCDATGPICRWITDPDWSHGSPTLSTSRSFPPLQMIYFQFLQLPRQQLHSQTPLMVQQGRGRPARKPPQGANRSSRQVLATPSQQFSPVGCIGLHWPLELARRLRSVCQVHKVPELLPMSGASLVPAYRTRPRCSATRFCSSAALPTTRRPLLGLTRCSQQAPRAQSQALSRPCRRTRGGSRGVSSAPWPMSHCASP